jgi:hypothetical protein
MSNVNALVSQLEEAFAAHGLQLVNQSKVATGEYPFIGQKAVKPVLESDSLVQSLTLQLLYQLQTEDEQATRDTKVKNKCGFMSSDAWHGSRIAQALEQGAMLTDEDQARLGKIASKYSKQLSVQLRRLALVRDPKLAGLAAVFSAS